MALTLPDHIDMVRDVPLAPLTTLGVGGMAAFYARTFGGLDTATALSWAQRHGMRVWILGGGSNVVIADGGLDGLVIHPADTERTFFRNEGQTWWLRAGAGSVWDELVEWLIEWNNAGLESLSGIPGCAGAAPIQNIGAYGFELAQFVDGVEALDRKTLRKCKLTAAECRFGYRDSIFKQEPERWVVLTTILRLERGGRARVSYDQVRKALQAQGFDEPAQLPAGRDGLRIVRETVLQLRRNKGMVCDPADPDSRSCGSFFVNPVLPAAEAESVRARLDVDARPMPWWPDPDGQRVKLSAAWLIERAGWKKGDGDGNVGLSSKHALALVNRGGAKAADVMAFAERVAGRVHAETGVRLEREPVALT
jgi:UDP-N-acetylmuramate dehydrogenase